MARSPLRVAIAGFGPFPGIARNPSAEVVRRLSRMQRFRGSDIRLFSTTFPTAYAAAEKELTALLKSEPDAIVLFGVAGRRREVCIETLARNAVSILAPDNARFVPQERALIAGGVHRIPLRAPARRLLQAAKSAGVRARISNDAGSYLCNASFYRALYGTHALPKPPLVVFVHIPMPRTNRPPRKPRKRLRHPLPPLPTFNALLRSAAAILAASISAARGR